MSKIVSYWYLVMRLWIQHQRGVGGGQCWQYNNVNPAIVIILWYSNYRENICQPYLYISGYHKVPSQTIPHYSPDHPHHALLWCLGQGMFRYSGDICTIHPSNWLMQYVQCTVSLSKLKKRASKSGFWKQNLSLVTIATAQKERHNLIFINLFFTKFSTQA